MCPVVRAHAIWMCPVVSYLLCVRVRFLCLYLRAGVRLCEYDVFLPVYEHMRYECVLLFLTCCALVYVSCVCMCGLVFVCVSMMYVERIEFVTVCLRANAACMFVSLCVCDGMCVCLCLCCAFGRVLVCVRLCEYDACGTLRHCVLASERKRACLLVSLCVCDVMCVCLWLLLCLRASFLCVFVCMYAR